MNVIVHMLEPQYDTDRIEDAVEMAIKALEQEPILDKIRAEIKHYNLRPSNYPCDMISIGTVLQIIDKYRGEVDCRECKAEYECYYCKKYAESEES